MIDSHVKHWIEFLFWIVALTGVCVDVLRTDIHNEPLFGGLVGLGIIFAAYVRRTWAQL